MRTLGALRALLIPRIQRGAFHGLDVIEDAALQAWAQAQAGERGPHGLIPQAGGAGHACAPLRLQARPQVPRSQVAWPQVERLVDIRRTQGAIGPQAGLRQQRFDALLIGSGEVGGWG